MVTLKLSNELKDLVWCVVVVHSTMNFEEFFSLHMEIKLRVHEQKIKLVRQRIWFQAYRGDYPFKNISEMWNNEEYI
jgi:hypothetical protein